MQSQTKTDPKTEAEKYKVISLHICFTSSRQKRRCCLCHLCPPVRDCVSGSARPGPEKPWVALSGSSRHFLLPPPLLYLLTAVFHGPALGLAPVDLADLAQCPGKARLPCCITPAGPGSGRVSRGSRRFSGGKPLQRAFWEESQAQIYICVPKLRIKQNSKLCKSNTCRVSTLHLLQDSKVPSVVTSPAALSPPPRGFRTPLSPSAGVWLRQDQAWKC